MRPFTGTWRGARHWAAVSLMSAESVDVGEWHSQPTKGNELLITRELTDVVMEVRINHRSLEALQEDLEPNLPWAEMHFQERIGGKPVNPPPSHSQWPHAHAQHQDQEEKFSHTYPERIWPKWAGARQQGNTLRGIRYECGDLDDIVNLLIKSPLTRQAYLPIYFPEDTGLNARMAEPTRVPCSLGYYFIQRNGRLDCKYTLRSCDFVRHWADDMYMAVRLLQHVALSVGVEPGRMTAIIYSLHSMQGDAYAIQSRLEDGRW